MFEISLKSTLIRSLFAALPDIPFVFDHITW